MDDLYHSGTRLIAQGPWYEVYSDEFMPLIQLIPITEEVNQEIMFEPKLRMHHE